VLPFFPLRLTPAVSRHDGSNGEVLAAYARSWRWGADGFSLMVWPRPTSLDRGAVIFSDVAEGAVGCLSRDPDLLGDRAQRSPFAIAASGQYVSYGSIRCCHGAPPDSGYQLEAPFTATCAQMPPPNFAQGPGQLAIADITAAGKLRGHILQKRIASLDRERARGPHHSVQLNIG